MSTAKPVRTFMFQSSPRLDSITALLLATETPEGQKMFPGAEKAPWELWGTGTVSPTGMSWQEYEAQGIVLIGVGGGPFDEHPSADFGDRKAEKASSTLLMARALGLENNPLYKGLIKMVTENDLGLVNSQSELSNIVKLMHRTGMDPFDVVRWTFEAVNAMVESQRNFLSACAAFKQADVRTFDGGPNGRFSLALVHSDNCQMGVAARYKRSDLAAVIQVRTSGHVQVLTNQKLGVRMHKVARAIRERELIAHLQAAEAKRHNAELEEPGQLPFVPGWCYQMPGENLLNGSETACGVPKTRLDPLTICRIVQANIEFAPPPEKKEDDKEEGAEEATNVVTTKA